jgi:bifunctional non-homologous end joining protein LigD
MPGFQPFQLCTLVARPPTGAEWLHEIKFDGYRVQLRAERGRPTWFTRHGHKWTDRFRGLTGVVDTRPDCILDGELCALGADGQPNSSALRSALARGGDTGALVMFCFDILFEGDRDLRPYALTARKACLKTMLEAGGPGAAVTLRYVDEFPAHGPSVFQAARALGLGGSSLRSAASRTGACKPALGSMQMSARPGGGDRRVAHPGVTVPVPDRRGVGG